MAAEKPFLRLVFSAPSGDISALASLLGRDEHSLREHMAEVTTSDADIAAMERRMARDARWERLNRSGIKSVLREEDRRRVAADELERTIALDRVREWLFAALAPKGPGGNVIVLAGPPGTGKTVAAAWAIASVGGRYVTTEEYLRSYARWQRDSTQADGTSIELDRYQGNGLLVLDEIGTERDAGLMRDALHRLVDRRQSRRRQTTIFVTNLSGQQFVERLKDGTYDPRTLDRLKRDGRIIGVRGESMRKGGSEW